MPTRLHARECATPERVRVTVRDSYLMGELYVPLDHRSSVTCPSVAVAGSLTSVKEQMAGIYAAEMSRRGVIALAIDYRNYGESGGAARQHEDPSAKVEDLSAAVAYLGQRFGRSSGVGLLGICTSGGNVIQAAARDEHVRAVATVAGHFAEPSVVPAFYAAMFSTGPEIVDRLKAQGRAARELYQRTGENTLVLAYSNTNHSAAHFGPMEYYMDQTRGGGVPQWRNAFAVQSWEPWLNFDPVGDAAHVTVPTCIVHSDECVMPAQARKVYERLGGPKMLHWATGPHFDFYDGSDEVAEAADVAAAHFQRHR